MVALARGARNDGANVRIERVEPVSSVARVIVKSLAIIVVCVALSIVYGILHDLVTVRMCIEYFTLAHPRLIVGPRAEDPTTLAVLWGVIATWWVGLIAGVALSIAARAGSWPKLTLRDLWIPIVGAVALVFVLAMMALVAGWSAGVSGRYPPPKWITDQMPYDRWRHFVSASWAHSASYGAGALAGLALCGHAVLLRWRRARGIARV